MILDVANLLTVGDPKSPRGDGDDWDLSLDGHAGSYFYYLNSIAYATSIAESMGVDDSVYYALTKRCVENNTHGGSDTNDTAPISLTTLQNIPNDWTHWNWSWQEDDEFDLSDPGILWLDRVIM